MSTHGHHLVADILLGATASRVQHNVSVPVLLLRAKHDQAFAVCEGTASRVRS